ncbi:LacI family DNA-binding transcriptional regulator [Sphingomonas oryzagri]|uniref:LacI family DNA-binding transcriptional regulator n=1 Tax=Sphingomonas oryzagri TaxID=3042314 RepID=A0ABT6MZY0_9SPHN|nr:LacI family DNA-binding transcriptional regulator [Sphingomonas oryzagri]MDH7638398.1 LacI family DNA-binding transcriptional regulator [Sphingomonas oryzagri]
MTQATIRDVAREAGLSVASVSRALNGHKSVRPETRAHVVAVADRLGYVPHAGARSLSMARSNAIGVVLPDLHGEFFSEIVRGMDREASRRGLQLLLSNMHADPAQATQALRAMRGRVDGLLIMSPQMRADGWSSAVPRGLPAVLINSSDDNGHHPALRMDNRAGAAAVARHFATIGRRSIVHVAGPDHNVDARERRDGFAEAIGREIPGALLTLLPGNFTEESGEAAARHILAENIPVDAIFAANDMMAVGCLQTLRDAGRQVPAEIAIAGFDDVPIARYLGLTTIRVGIAEIGARAVERLATMMDDEGDDAPLVEWHQPDLVVRGTTTGSAPQDKS